MTAVVGILNKQAVAIAADSAVTVNEKVYNNAMKIFTLSKYHPVGIMIYNSATFLGTPWETIIKMYRKQLGKKSFSKLKEYLEDFVEYLRSKNFFSDELVKKQYLAMLYQELLNKKLNDIIEKNQTGLSQNDNSINKSKILDILQHSIRSELSIVFDENQYYEEFIDYKLTDFTEYNSDVLNHIFTNWFATNGYDTTETLRNDIIAYLYAFTKLKEANSNYTGLIFVGFGEEEIYPQLIPINVSLSIGKRLRYYVDEINKANITETETAFIKPFAQTDVIHTILSGIDPGLETLYGDNFARVLKKYNDFIVALIETENKELASKIKLIDFNNLVNEYFGSNHDAKLNNYIIPLMSTIDNLSKEDLAEMAESLIYLTFLKRRFTFAKESVGGPVDVAIISKGDGFIWIKRKHYFKPDLNQFFFKNYFND